MLGRLQKESMSDPKNPFFLSFFFLHLVTTEREIVSSESSCFRFNPLASLKLRLVSFHDAWSPVQFLTRASRFLTPFPFTSPSIFSRAAYLAFLSVVETVHSLSRVDHRPLDETVQPDPVSSVVSLTVSSPLSFESTKDSSFKPRIDHASFFARASSLWRGARVLQTTRPKSSFTKRGISSRKFQTI